MAQLDEVAIFNNALTILPPDKRETYLRQACGDDQTVYNRLVILLRTYDAEPDFLESPPVEFGPPLDRVTITEGPGTVIGRYKLLELIGEGGFAVVYMAEQTEPIRRQVALKIIKLGMDTRQVIARFEAERQALALMDHPNIAKVHDAGATETGRPYFVMQLIRGTPITQYCDENQLTTETRLRLFLDVCRAIQHAHQKGIIHRDIKPTNVLVALHDGQPVPKVIDFGIAKATHQRLTEKTLYTSYRQIIGTPQYMSPEQAEFSDLDIDTRSDIYSLGVLLYELLTSTTPFQPDDLDRLSYHGICHSILVSEPPMPSRRLSTLGDAATAAASNRQVDPAGLRKLLHGDLDWIVMKALDKDRARRYETADALATDIERHMTNEPIQARPQSTAYQLRKLVRKHRGPVIAATAILAALILALVVALTSLVRIKHEQHIATMERDRAEENLQLARQLVQDVLAPATDRLGFVSDYETTQRVQADLRRQAVAFYERILDQTPQDPNARLEMARLYLRISETSFLSGEHQESFYARSFSILDDLVAQFPHDPTYRLVLAQSHNAVGSICWADLRWKDASKHYAAALKRVDVLAEQFPRDATYRDQRVKSHGMLAYALQHSGELADAEKHYRQALTDGTLPGAISRQRLADLLISSTRFVEAKQQLDEALKIVEQVTPKTEWDNQLNALWTSVILNDYGMISICVNRPEEAVRHLEASLKICRELTQAVPHSPFPANQLGWTYFRLNESLVQRGQPKEAEQAVRDALRVWQSERGRMPLHHAGLAYLRLGDLLHFDGRVEEARTSYQLGQKVLEEISRELPNEPYCQQRLIVFLANCPDEQFRDPQRAADLAKHVVSASNGTIWRYLALSQYRCGAWHEARESLQKSMQLRNGGDAMDLLLLAMTLSKLGQRSEALQLYARAQNAISSGQPIFYGEIGVLGFKRLLAEAAPIFDAAGRSQPSDQAPADPAH